MTEHSALDAARHRHDHKDTPTAAQLWRLFAPAIAAMPRVRVAVDDRQFRRKWERNLVADIRPAKPAAVRTYDAAGDTRCLVFDLDCKKPGIRAAVLRDCERLTSWLGEAGCSFFVDESPAGGRHVYVPLDHARPQSEIAPVLKGLRASGALVTLDTGPMVNLTEGCIRPPGATHRMGGFQQLVTPLNVAMRAVMVRTSPHAWEALLTLLPIAEVTRIDVARLVEAVPAAGQPAWVDDRGGARPLSPYFAAIAVTGDYDIDRYGSPSQARAAVVLHAVGRGWTEQDFRREMNAGRWPGLARLYTDKYGSSYADTALYGRGEQLKGDLGRAREFIDAHPLHRSLTSASRPRRGAGEPVDLHLRRWIAALELALTEGRWETSLSYGRELVLIALADAARRTRRREVEHGTRHLSMNAGTVLNPSTVAAHLRALRVEEDPFVLLVESARGAGADVYELVIPDQYADRLPPEGSLPAVPRGVHPVFGRLSKPAYRLYTALSGVDGPSTSAAELAEVAHMPVRTVWAVLSELVAHRLVTKLGCGKWRRGRRSLDRVARALGVPTRLRDLVIRWREERDVWRMTLGLPARDLPWPKTVAWPGAPARAVGPAPATKPPPPHYDDELDAMVAGASDWRTQAGLADAIALHLLHDTLGAELITEPRPSPIASVS